MQTWGTSAARAIQPRVEHCSCCPALALNYLGQGATADARIPGQYADNPFFRMFPELRC